MNERIEPVGGIRVTPAGPLQRLQRVARERDRGGGGGQPRDEPEEEHGEGEEDDGGLHVDVLA